MDKIKTFLNHERYKTIGLSLGMIFTIFMHSCASTVPSLVDPQKKVTRDELKIELDTYLATAEVRFAELDRQDEFKNTLTSQVMLFAQSGGVNPIGTLLTIAGLLGVGAVVDDVRTRRKVPKPRDQTLQV